MPDTTATVENNPPWLRALIRKRTPDILAVLAELTRAGLRDGYTSANDVTTRDSLTHPNAIGGAFGTLRALGFVKTYEPIAPAFKSQRGRRVFKWLLAEPSKARAFLDGVAGMLLPVNAEAESLNQPELF